MKTRKLALVAGALLVSALSHAHTLPDQDQQADMRIDATQRGALINALVEQVNQAYVFPEQALKVDQALRQHQKRGDYNAITSAAKLSDTLSADMFTVTKDKHLRLYYSAAPIPVQVEHQAPSAEQQAARLAQMQAANFGIERVEHLPFNIGYLDLRGFLPAKAASASIGAAMTLLSNADALIIDLRNNGGGDANTVTMLASYFFDERTHLTDIYYRSGNRLEQMWSTDFVSGTHFGQKKDVYILTSKFTFSAAENFSYAMKNSKRATIIGETTAGGAHPGQPVRLGEHFSVFVPKGRAISPVTNTDWEGVGVAPDVSVPADDALKTAQLAILNKIAASEKDGDQLARLNARMAAVNAGDNSAH